MSFIANYLLNLYKTSLSIKKSEALHPLLFSYYITHRCNLFCKYCCDGDGKRFKEDPCYELNTNESLELRKIIRKAGDTLDITGGEPLIRTDLEDILSGAKKLGFRTILNTKGLGLKERSDILKYTDVLVLGIDTLNPTRLSDVIGADINIANEILSSLEWIMAQRGQYKFSLAISSVAMLDNMSDVSEIARYCGQRNCHFHISPEIIGIKANKELNNNPAYINLINELIALKKKGVGILGVEDYLKGIRDFKDFKCYPFLMPTIRPSGELYYPCMEKQTLAGNLLEIGDYYRTMEAGRKQWGKTLSCHNCCHIFCHMGLSLLQQHPLRALGELKMMHKFVT